MAEKTNPYIAGAPVVEKSMFFGREGVFEWIENSLTGKYVDHILVLHGQRRVGKTSVLKHIPNRLPDKYIPIFIDLQGRVSTSLGRFLGWLAREISRALKAEGIDLPRPDRKAFEEDPDFFETTFLPTVKQALGDRTLLLTFDEFDTFESTDAQENLAIPFMAILKRLMDQHYLSFVFSIGSSGRKLENMQAAYTSFFKQALYRKISFLGTSDARDLIVKPVEGIVSYSDAAVQRIIEVTNAHPYFIQLVCHELFSECQKSDRWTVTLEDVNAVLEPVVERGTVNLKFVWDEANDLEKWILACLAAEDSTVSFQVLEARLQREQVRFTRQQLERALLHLREKDVLFDDNRFVIYLLKMWLVRNRPMEQVREELEEVNPIVSRLLEIGQEYHDKGEYERAIESFENALAAEGENLEAHLWLGNSQLARGDYGKAIAEFEIVLEVKIDDVVAQKGFCDAYLAMGDESKAEGKLEEAEYAYQQVLGVNPQHQAALHRMAGLHHRRAVGAITGSQEVALQELETALKYAEEDTFRKAYNELKAFVAGEQKLDDLLLTWGQQAQEMGLWDEARELLDAYRRESGDEQTVHEAIEEIRTHITQQRQDTLRQRATRLAGLERRDEAIEAWNSYLAISPDKAQEVRQKIEDLQNQAKEAEAKQGGISPMVRNMVIGVVVILIAIVSYLLAQPTSPLMVALAEPTSTPTRTLAPTPTLTSTRIPPTPTTAPTATPPLQPTAIPLSWTRLNSGIFLERDEITALVIDPSDPDVIYAGTANSKIYKTINSGVSWEPAQAGIGGRGINSLVVDKNNPEILYTGVLQDGAYKSVDGGESWTKLKIPFVGLWEGTSQITIDPSDSNILYFSDGFDFYISTDVGENWKPYKVKVERGEGQVAVVTGGPDGILYFTDTFSDFLVNRIDPELKEVQSLMYDPNDSGMYEKNNFISIEPQSGAIFSGSRIGLIFSQDNGETWTNTGLDCYGTVFDGNGNALCYGNQLYYSSNNGKSWVELYPPDNFQILSGLLSPSDPDLIIIGGKFEIYKSTNGGATWETANNGIGNLPSQLLVNSQTNMLYLEDQSNASTKLFGSEIGSREFSLMMNQNTSVGRVSTYIGVDGTVYRFASEDNTGLSINLGPYQTVGIGNKAEEWVGAGGFVQDGQDVLFISIIQQEDDLHLLYFSRDYGNTWEPEVYATSDYTHGISRIVADPTDDENIYGISPILYYHQAGEELWKDCEPGFGNFDSWISDGYHVFSPDPDSNGYYFLATRGYGLIQNSSPFCWTGKVVSGIPSLSITSVVRHPTNPDTIYVGTANGFYISYDNGESWGQVNDGLLGALTIYSLAVDTNNPGIVYAATPYGVFQLIDQ